jgi:RNA polymerase sigma factor (sigma-70 family)
METPEPRSSVLPLPVAASEEAALAEFEFVYAYFLRRVGNRADAEDLTQQVALKALPRLRSGASVRSVRAYLFRTAQSVLAGFWRNRLGQPEVELREDLAEAWSPPQSDAWERLRPILERLPAHYRRLLELRFLRGCSLKEAAVGAVKVMQLRALRAAARAADE